jgi:endonuclease YncB( thermonuclease family)
MGILRIRGSIELDQFWPQHDSDADTSKVKVHVAAGSFAFSRNGRTYKTTRAYDNAFVRGASRDAVIENGRITVRLQGIDAPELHYRAPALSRSRSGVTDAQRAAFNKENRTERRQHLAESATVALARKLAGYGSGEIACQVVSLVEHPYEAVDTYGRFIGNLRVGSRFRTDLNLWLVAQGWALPTFYSSMTAEEIQALLAAAVKGRKLGRVFAHLSGDTARFDRKLVYRGKGASPAPDEGPLLMPKLFRRQVACEMQKLAGVFRGTFKTFLARSPDTCFLLDEFLEQSVHSAPLRALHDFLDGTRFAREPHELVFREKFSSVVDADGNRVEEF